MLVHLVRTGCFESEAYTVTGQTIPLPPTPTRPTDLCRARGIIVALIMALRA